MGEAMPEKLTVYFGYGSNLWLDQMAQRCPKSNYLGIARLKDYRWIISERGYANVVKIDDETDTSARKSKHSYKDEVWGLVYSLTASDEQRLDGNEGVPDSYQKLTLECDFWSARSVIATGGAHRTPEKTDMLVYVSKDFLTPSKPKKEYIYRMNMGIKDALKEGVPKDYIEQVLRHFIPDVDDDAVREVAERQALRFIDEN